MPLAIPLFSPRQSFDKAPALRVAVLAPLVELVVSLPGERDIGHNNRVQCAGGITRRSVGVAAGVVLVLSGRVTLPGHTVLGDVDGGLGGGGGRGAAWIWLAAIFRESSSMRGRRLKG